MHTSFFTVHATLTDVMSLQKCTFIHKLSPLYQANNLSYSYIKEFRTPKLHESMYKLFFSQLVLTQSLRRANFFGTTFNLEIFLK